MSPTKMPLDKATVLKFAERYLEERDEKTKKALKSEREIEAMVSQVREAGFLTRGQFLLVCRWKTPRIMAQAELNNEVFVQEATQTAFSAETEEMRIGALRLLKGVQYSVASAFLHWFHEEPYPIIDQWALAALGIEGPARDDDAYWAAYVTHWREAIQTSGGGSIRTFDRALWQWGKDHNDLNKGTNGSSLHEGDVHRLTPE